MSSFNAASGTRAVATAAVMSSLLGIDGFNAASGTRAVATCYVARPAGYGVSMPQAALGQLQL